MVSGLLSPAGMLCSIFLPDKTFHLRRKLIKTESVLGGGVVKHSVLRGEFHKLRKKTIQRLQEVPETDQVQ